MKPGPWPPVIVLAAGALLATVGVRSQHTLDLRAPLAETVERSNQRYASHDLTLSAAEIDVLGLTTYLSRVFERPDTAGVEPEWYQLYVGYYNRQTSGKTIHSPRNCLPGSGWEPLTNSVSTIATAAGPVQVNRYLIQNGKRQALVLYWYQGRGRVASNEYLVKWDLVRDAALRRRSEEALVRVMVPLKGSEDAAFELASKVAGRLVRSVDSALPS